MRKKYFYFLHLYATSNAISTNNNAKCNKEFIQRYISLCFLCYIYLYHIPNVRFPCECIMINIAKQSHCMTCCILRNNLISYCKIMSALYYLKDIFPM